MWFSWNEKVSRTNLASKNLIGKNDFPAQLAFAKSMIQTSLSREFVDFILIDLNLQIYIKQLEWKRGVSPEESFFATLHATDALGAPGGFTHACLDKNISVPSITRCFISILSKHSSVPSAVGMFFEMGTEDFESTQNQKNLPYPCFWENF